MKQIKLHKKINEFIKAGLKAADVSVAREFVGSKDNFDARDYFYEIVGADWIDWLHEHEFFAVLNQEAEDQAQYSYRMPELNYLERVAKEKPDEVTKVILEINPEENFNPEVIDRFTRIAESLEGKNLAKVVAKLHKENWVLLMRKFNTWSHPYQRIAEKLVAEGNIDSLLLLSDVLMTVDEDRDQVRSNPFVVSHIGDIELYKAFVELDGEGLEKAYRFCIDKLAEIIGDNTREDSEDRVFKIEEPYYLLGVDLFDHGFGEKYSRSYRDDMENFMAAITAMTEKLFAGKCGQEGKLRDLYEHLDKTVPDSWTGWRLRLYTASFCGELFGKELQAMFNKLFEVMESGKSYYEIESGAEYKKALRASWPELGYDFKQAYIENVFTHFDPQKSDDETEQRYRRRDALQILKMIEKDVDDERVKKVFTHSLTDERIQEPTPTITRGYAGTVTDRSPVAISDKSVADLPELLKTELRPEEVEQKYKNDPFHNPRNVEGIGSELRADVQERLEDYVGILEQFFAPGEIHEHYTSCVLQGIEYYVRDKKPLSDKSWLKIFELIELLESPETELVSTKASENTYLANWSSVRRTSAEILKYTLSKDVISDETFTETRARLLGAIRSLLEGYDPKPEEGIQKLGNLRSIGINRSQGIAYQAYIQFLYRDGEKLQDDTKDIFQSLLEKDTTSLSTRSLMGQYLPSIYFRDPSWIEDRLPALFKIDDAELFFSAWEGYVNESIYFELFDLMEEYYSYVLGVNGSAYPGEDKDNRVLDQAIGAHLSLAYTHFPSVTLKHPLIVKLWSEADAKKQEEFMSHMGRSFVSSNQIKSTEEQIDKVITLWDWLLEKEKGEISVEAYGEFGFWIRDKGVEDILPVADMAKRFAKLLELSGGRLDYEYHLKDKLPELAQVDPVSVLSIMRSLLLGEEAEKSMNVWLRSDSASLEVFEILYKAKPVETEELVNDLLERKGRVFWGLKSVLDS